MSESIRYNPNATPAEGNDAIRFIARRLREDDGVQAGDYRIGSVAVYEERRPADAPERYIIVRELAESGGRVEHHTGRDEVPVQVITSCEEDNDSQMQFHETMHLRIWECIVGQKFEEGHSVTANPIRRTRKPTRSIFPTGTGQSEQIAQYAVPLLPKGSPYLH